MGDPVKSVVYGVADSDVVSNRHRRHWSSSSRDLLPRMRANRRVGREGGGEASDGFVQLMAAWFHSYKGKLPPNEHTRLDFVFCG